MLKIFALLCLISLYSSCIFNQDQNSTDAKEIWVLDSINYFWNENQIGHEKWYIGKNGTADSVISTDFRDSTSKSTSFYYSNLILDSIITKSIDGYYSKSVYIYDEKGSLIEIKSNDTENASTPVIQISRDEHKNIKEIKYLDNNLTIMYKISYFYSKDSILDSTKEFSLWYQNDTKIYTYINDTTICKTFSYGNLTRIEKTIVSKIDSFLTQTTTIVDDTLISTLSEIKDNFGNKIKEFTENNTNNERSSTMYYWRKTTI